MSKVIEIIGLSMGEESKGSWVEYMVNLSQAGYVWRKGGPQSGHHLVINENTEMMLSHFGAGVFQEVVTYVDMPIIPAELFREAIDLKEKGVLNPLDLIVINASCLVVTPFHQSMSRLSEILRKKKKGTIGLGVGLAIKEAKAHPQLSIHAFDFFLSRNELEEKIESVRLSFLDRALEMVAEENDIVSEQAVIEIEHLKNENLAKEIVESYILLSGMVSIVYEDYLDEVLSKNAVIETSHGALLHPRYGFVPHVTQIDPSGQDALLRMRRHQFSGELLRFGVFRSYGTRFGAGPFVSFDEEMTETIPEIHHNDDPWLGQFRKGHLDMVNLIYAMKVCGEPKLDGVMISFFDLLEGKSNWQICEAYEYHGGQTHLDNYFEMAGDKIIGIKLLPDDGTTAHLRHQEELTNLLFDCTPVLTTITATETKSLTEMLIDYIEKKLGVPVVATACGPKMSDRSLRKSLWR